MYGEAGIERVTSTDVTGLLLCLPTGWIHLVEASQASLSELLRVLNRATSGGGNLTEVKVISSMDDVPKRNFATWSHKGLDVQRGNYEADLTDAQVP